MINATGITGQGDLKAVAIQLYSSLTEISSNHEAMAELERTLADTILDSLASPSWEQAILMTISSKRSVFISEKLRDYSAKCASLATAMSDALSALETIFIKKSQAGWSADNSKKENQSWGYLKEE